MNLDQKSFFKREGFQGETKDLHVELVKVIFIQRNIIIVKVEGSIRGLWDVTP